MRTDGSKMNSDFLKKNVLKITIFVFAILFLLSLLLLLPKHSGVKRIFYYPPVGTDFGDAVSSAKREVRYLPASPVQGDVRMYVDELLLGSAVHDRLDLFSAGAVCEFCELQGKTLFVGLSSDAALQLEGSTEIESGIKLFRKSILKNFKYIDYVELFIGGNQIEESQIQ